MLNKAKRFTPYLLICAYLILIDLAINIILPYPKDPRNISPSAIRQFFEYGRSVEGKLIRMTRKTNDESAPIISVGWLDSSINYEISKDGNKKNKPIVTVYGMSHAGHLAEDMAKIDNSFTVRSVGAPGAIPTWSYSAYLFDSTKTHSDVVILGIMTNGVPYLGSTSGATNHFDRVYPYTYPRFFLSGDSLRYVLPPFVSFKEYLDYFYDSDKWANYLKWMQKYDKYYDPWLFRKTFLDNSSLFRLLRRAYAYSTRRKKEAVVYNDTKGFNIDSDEVKILQSIIVEFSSNARRNKSIPIIYIVNNVFTGNRLYEILAPTLSSHNILFLSTHNICPPNDPRCYLPDSHFIPAKNLELAIEMMRIIRENIGQKTSRK